MLGYESSRVRWLAQAHWVVVEFERQSNPKRWGCSSAGRAPDLHSGGRRFDPDQLHQFPLGL